MINITKKTDISIWKKARRSCLLIVDVNTVNSNSKILTIGDGWIGAQVRFVWKTLWFCLFPSGWYGTGWRGRHGIIGVATVIDDGNDDVPGIQHPKLFIRFR